MNGLYSPWATWSKMARDFIGAQKSPERLRAFVNVVLGESWQSPSEQAIDNHALMARREQFSDTALPEGVALLTAGIDVQADRLEIEVCGWGRDEESWSIGYHIIPGDPARAEIWQHLDRLLLQTWQHPSGMQFRIRAACVDAGYQTAAVTRFCKERLGRGVFAVKGHTGARTIWPRRITRRDGAKHSIFIVGVDAAKEAVYSRLRIETPGAGYCHFPLNREQVYFEQLTAEVCRIRYAKGFARSGSGRKSQGRGMRPWTRAAMHTPAFMDCMLPA